MMHNNYVQNCLQGTYNIIKTLFGANRQFINVQERNENIRSIIKRSIIVLFIIAVYL